MTEFLVNVNAEMSEYYLIHVENDNKEIIQPDPRIPVTLRIPIPKGVKKLENCCIFHVLSEDWDFEVFDNESGNLLIDNDCFVIEVSSFSPFIVYEIMNPKISVTQKMNKATLPFGEKRILTADVKDLPDGAKIIWTADKDALVTLKPSEDRLTCEVQAKKSGNVTITAKIVDADGKEIKQDGKAVSASVTLQTKAGIFHKLFFWIFRIPWPFPKN